MTDVRAAKPSRSLTYAGYFAFILIGWNANLIPSLIRSLEHDFHRSDATFSLIYFVGALVYGSGTLGSGFLIERVGRKPVLPIAAGLLGLGLMLEGGAAAWALLLLAAVPVNWAAGVIDAGANGLFLDLYRDARGGALNLLHVFFGVGALVAPFAIGLLLSHGVNWRIILLGTGLCASPLVVALLVSPIPAGKHAATPRETSATTEGGEGMSRLPFLGLAVAIGCYVATELGVSAWVVRYLADQPIATATAVLSLYWAGLAAGRLLSSRIADQFDYFAYTIACIVLMCVSIGAALIAPWIPLVAGLFCLAGLFSGPVFPMIVALGGNIYPHRLAALSGGLTTSAVVGGLIFPPSIGVLSSTIGLRGGLLGAALLGIPQVGGILLARHTSGSRSSD